MISDCYPVKRPLKEATEEKGKSLKKCSFYGTIYIKGKIGYTKFTCFH